MVRNTFRPHILATLSFEEIKSSRHKPNHTFFWNFSYWTWHASCCTHSTSLNILILNHNRGKKWINGVGVQLKWTKFQLCVKKNEHQKRKNENISKQLQSVSKKRWTNTKSRIKRILPYIKVSKFICILWRSFSGSFFTIPFHYE